MSALLKKKLATRKHKAEGRIPSSMSHTTVWRHLGDGTSAVKHRGVRKQPLITPSTAGKRIKFVIFHATTNWDTVFFLDSMYLFVCNMISKKQWVPADVIPTTAQLRGFWFGGARYMSRSFSAT